MRGSFHYPALVLAAGAVTDIDVDFDHNTPTDNDRQSNSTPQEFDPHVVSPISRCHAIRCLTDPLNEAVIYAQ